MLEALKIHDFITKEQSEFCNSRKGALNEGEILVKEDFSEKYSFTLQDRVREFHWVNTQATIYPFIS